MKVLHTLTFCEPRDYIHLFLEKNELYPCFTEVWDTFSGKNVYKGREAPQLKATKHHYLFFDIPEYFQTVPDRNLAQKRVKSFKGSLIHLSRYSDFQHFFKEKFSSKHRAELSRQKRKLSRSFEVKHRVYYGSISEKEYDQLFQQFKEMLTIRFLEKGIKNDDLPFWEHYHKTFYDLVNTKRACISVIFESNKPISFSVNLIYGDTIYGYFKSYDIAYAKYSLGTLEMLSLLEWTYKVNLSKFDLLKGQYPYKSKLIDEEYYFVKSILTQRASWLSSFMGLITFARVFLFYKGIRTLKKLKADRFYHYLKKKWYSLRNPKKSSSNYRIIPYKPECKEEQMELIDIEKPKYRYLRRALYDFVYSSGDRLKDVAIFRASPESGTFLLKGKEKKRVVQVGGNSINATL